MLEEAIDTIIDLCVKARGAKSIHLPKNGVRDHQRIRMLDAQCVPTGDVMIPPRSIQCTSIAGLSGVVSDYINDPDMQDKQVRVYVGDRRVMAILDERGDRADEAYLNIEYDVPYKRLLDGHLESIDQEDLIWELRKNYADRVDATFLPSIRALRFTTNQTSGVIVNHGKETKDQSIERELAGAGGSDVGAVAETVTFDVPVYEILNGLFHSPITCAVRIDLQRQAFTISPLPGEIVKAESSAREYIAARLNTEIEYSERLLVISDACQ